MTVKYPQIKRCLYLLIFIFSPFISYSQILEEKILLSIYTLIDNNIKLNQHKARVINKVIYLVDPITGDEKLKVIDSLNIKDFLEMDLILQKEVLQSDASPCFESGRLYIFDTLNFFNTCSSYEENNIYIKRGIDVDYKCGLILYKTFLNCNSLILKFIDIYTKEFYSFSYSVVDNIPNWEKEK